MRGGTVAPMRPLLLASSLIALTSVALAGGGGARPAPATLPGTALVQPGQTWVMTGTTAAGEPVQVKFALTRKAPERSGTDWNFDAPNGPFTYSPDEGTLFAADILPSLTTGAPVQLCVAMFDGKEARGALLSGRMDDIDAQMAQIPDDAPEPKNAAEIVHILRSYGVAAGTCTLKRGA